MLDEDVQAFRFTENLTHVLYLNHHGVFKIRNISGTTELNLTNPCFNLSKNTDFFFVNEHIAAI